MKHSEEEKPSVLYVFGVLMLSQVAMEWVFYFVHRLMHIPSLYGRIHKQHHEYKGTIGYAAEYANPIEGLAANFYPTLVGCMYTGSHPLVFYVYLNRGHVFYVHLNLTDRSRSRVLNLTDRRGLVFYVHLNLTDRRGFVFYECSAQLGLSWPSPGHIKTRT